MFLNVLRRDLIWGQDAQEDLRRLDSGRPLASQRQILRLRSVMFCEDAIEPSSECLLGLLLARNPSHRMAFEYLMARYLLTCQLDKIVENVPQLRKLGDARIPEHYAEAILLHGQLTQRQPDLDGWSVAAATVERFRAVVRLTRGLQRDPDAIERLPPGTYYPYYFLYTGSKP